MNKKLLSLYGLKWNPFSPDLPTEALRSVPQVQSFCWRIEQGLVREGGFALITGDPGTGKSVVLRILAERLEALREVSVGALAHPQSNVADFYREMGDLFGVQLKPHNRWGGFKALRERWIASRNILSVVLAGDGRLTERLRREELLPLGSRIRTRLMMEYVGRDELRACLEHLLETAGNKKLMTPELVDTLCDHAVGNYRVLTTMASELLTAAAERECTQLDEKLYLELFAPPESDRPRRAPRGRRSR
jgi:type II secretory pathway predicted ATPase ExeA